MAEKQDKDKLLWWEIPARGAVLVIMILFFIPDHWYRAAYHNTLGRFFRKTVETRMEKISPDVEKRISLKQIPSKIWIIALKQERRLEAWGEDASGKRTLIKSVPIIAASGKTGPKLREGDKQVPEGIYPVDFLNPNSLFYLSLRVGYPSEEDKRIAHKEGRDIATLGGDIMIHGSGPSAGCLSIANRSMEEIFYLAAKSGIENTTVIIAPFDFREKPLPENTEPEWLHSRYQDMEKVMKTMINLKR